MGAICHAAAPRLVNEGFSTRRSMGVRLVARELHLEGVVVANLLMRT